MTTQATPLLPYGSTLHHQRCGCPPDWKRGTRAADVVDLLLHKAVQAFQQNKLLPTRHLRVAYMLPHNKITGAGWRHRRLCTCSSALRLSRCCCWAQAA